MFYREILYIFLRKREERLFPTISITERAEVFHGGGEAQLGGLAEDEAQKAAGRYRKFGENQPMLFPGPLWILKANATK